MLKYLLFYIIFWQNIENISIEKAINLHYERNFEDSLIILNKIKVDDSNRAKVEFFKLCNLFFLNRKEDVFKQYEYLENFVVDMPERYRVVSWLMLKEAEQWQKNTLDDISRDQKRSADRLFNGNAGKTTQKLQDSIVKRLDKLIEEKENPKKKEQSADSQSGQKQEMKPLDQSKITNDSGPGIVENKRIAGLMKNWGSLPPREQARALQEITQGMSARHREGIENYFRKLGEKK